jgi:uncharacterized protein
VSPLATAGQRCYKDKTFSLDCRMPHAGERYGKRYMKICSFVVLLLALTLLPFQIQAQVLKFPQTNVPINDYAEVIPPEYQAQMDRLARALWDKTGTALVVATFRDVGGESPRIFANKLYEAWGIGKSGEDKGVLLLVAVKERQVTFETGYGVEGILPDAKMGAILDQYVVPFLRRDEYGEGLFNGMAAVAQVVAKNAGVRLNLGRYAPRASVQPKTWRVGGLSPLFLIVLFIILGLFGRRRRLFPFFFFPFIFMGGGRGMGGGFSGGFGGFGGGMSGGGGTSRGF